MLATVQSAALLGIDAIPVTVEVDVNSGLPSFTTVGLPDGSIRESKDRVKSAIKNSGYPFPNRKITINLAPADLKKEGTAFDLPIALGLLASVDLIDPEVLRRIFAVGELSLDGSLRGIPGVLSIALAAADHGAESLIIPASNSNEASMTQRVDIIAARTLFEVVEILNGVRAPHPLDVIASPPPATDYPYDIADIRGHRHVKRALEIAASGMHNILLEGPPGTGKTMLAKALPSIIGDWSLEERLETTKVYSTSGLNRDHQLIEHRPFRAPHHTISDAGLIGGGTIPRPGEVSLAHNGVLFLDELPEFRRHVLEVLRQPLEDGLVTIARAQASISFPARFMLVAAMNPCPCGYLGSRRNECRCTDTQIMRYRNRISGPLLDRIDMRIEVPEQDIAELQDSSASECSADVRDRVNAVHAIQRTRFHNTDIANNSRMNAKNLQTFCHLNQESELLIKKSVKRLGLSGRSYHRILKIARTIADMENSEAIGTQHIAEAISFRREQLQRP